MSADAVDRAGVGGDAHDPDRLPREALAREAVRQARDEWAGPAPGYAPRPSSPAGAREAGRGGERRQRPRQPAVPGGPDPRAAAGTGSAAAQGAGCPGDVVSLTGEGPGRELVAHLDAVLDSLARPAPGDRLPAADAERLLRLFDAQAGSRWLDVAARRMRAARVGHYTIGSAGHEANGAVALAVTARDPALLHYRSGAFYLARSAQRRRTNKLTSGVGPGLLDIALGLAATAKEPIAGGRHKVFGHPDIAVIPQTSTIASHLPRAVGIAWTLGRQQRLPDRLRTALAWPDDAVVVASFGDASANHSTAAGAVNAACWTAHQGIPLPLLLVCEDNGYGISTRTPAGWVAAQFSGRAGLVYRYDDGSDPLASLRIAADAAALAREERVPVLLHLRCVRIGGHAGSDVETGYRSAAEVAAELGQDPLAATVRALVRHQVLPPSQVAERWISIRDEVAACVEEALCHRGLETADEVMRPLAPRSPDRVAARATQAAPSAERERVFGATLPETEGGLTLAQAVNRALLDEGARTPGLLVLGEDVGRMGGVYGVTRGLQRRLGVSRVVDTLLDEQTVLGMALGAGVSGLLPVAEIQYLAYLHNAEDQLRGEAASLQFFSQGAYRNPLVVRVQGLAYQKGFGGHFHNDNAIGVLRDVPGLVIACPAHPSDAPALLRTCLAAAEVDGTVSVVLEPIALYHERDLYQLGDGRWLAPYAAPGRWEAWHAPIGSARTWGVGTDLTMVTFGNGLRMSLRVARRLAEEGVGVRVVDLRWLAPLPVGDVLREASATGRCLIVDETRRAGGVSEALVAQLLEAGYRGALARLNADDTYVPLGAAADLVLVSEDDVDDAARSLLDHGR
ncbi:MAG TPA: thiamine pyrophosphate-dependent enzyme [Kineosporiaceae bacterium]